MRDDDFAGPEEPTRPLEYQQVPFETLERIAMSERPTRNLKPRDSTATAVVDDRDVLERAVGRGGIV